MSTMALTATRPAAHQLASLVAWWHDAGVDCIVEDAPRSWLEAPKPSAPPASAMPPPAAVIPAMPDTLDEFRHWLATAEGIPEAGPAVSRLPFSGNAGADLMIIVDMPALGEAEAGRLLGADAGEMFDRMLAALGRDRDSSYIAALCPGRAPTGRLAPESHTRLGEIGRRHIALAAPKRVWLMGDAVSRAILGMDLAEARGRLHRIKDVSETIAAMVSFSPLYLLRNPQRKRETWAEMQKFLMGDEA
jgi:DNA polymerase